ncbi:MAG TPA: type VI secretion system tip protein TssI/VgrG [Polyangiaceae bacterium]|jgi:type VI secretion system secreted protein VgrG|nr:type VI secretion system tip protein TssI/VgrG [Polyangiaceae bacterium]
MGEPIAFECSIEVDGTSYDVVWLEASEALDAISEIQCEVTDGAGGPDPGALLGKDLLLTLQRGEGNEARQLAGLVVEAERTMSSGEEATETGTRLVAQPRLFRLPQRADCRIFQDLSAREIAEQVLEGAGIPGTDQAWRVEESYPKRVYTAQYRESDYDFLKRLLSEEGIAFAIDSSSGTDVVVFFDGNLGPIEGDPVIPFGLGDGLDASRDAIGDLSHEASTAPGKTHLRDYDFERPRLKLDATAEGDDEAERTLEVYAHPGRFTDASIGERYAKVLLESLRARREVVSGTTSSLRLTPGRTFSLEDHPYEPLNQEYLIISVDITFDARRWSGRREGGDVRGARVQFKAIPASAVYRPSRAPRAASIPGAQTAVTTGAGQEIHTDKHGRVKVLFPWDRLGKPDDSSSLWVRTTQLPLGGGMLTPRVGWEVVVDFIEGDPDQPLVCGRLYNTKSPPPYPLPENKTRTSIQTATTPGGGSTNEIRMEDKAGSEEMFMNASKDASISAGNNATESVGNNETRSIGANQKLSVTDSVSANIGADQSLSVGGNQATNVSTFMVDDVGSHSLSIGGNRDLNAGGDHKRTVTGASKLTVGGMQVDLVAGSVDEEGMATMDDTVGAALVELTPSDRTVTVKGSRTETAGAAKVILSAGGRSVQIGGSLNQSVAGAILTKISADRQDQSQSDFLEVAGGAQIIKATNVVFQADNLLSVVMGASTITLTPASVSIAGAKITLDGECDEQALLITDN